MKIIFIGPPGSGKSSVGKEVAAMLKLSHIDTDQLIEEKSGKRISDIFLDDGEPAFRRMEREIVLEVLQQDNCVISLGGGSVIDSEVADKLRVEPNVIHLEVSISNAAPRVGFNAERPLLVANPRQQWLKLMEDRKPIYEGLGRKRISTDNRKPREIAREIAGLLS
jgi:shikimate kinase